MFDQLFSDAAALNTRLDKQRVNFRVAVFARQDHRKADDSAVLLQDEHPTGRDLLNR